MIDLRSDTVTQPTPAMREAMHRAGLGDDVYGEDPTVNELERLAAEMTGKEAAVFTPSGTQSNLIALLAHCQRGHEYIVGQAAHTYLYEGGGAAVLGGIQPCPIPFTDAGELPLDDVQAAIKPDDSHFAITRLVCLENTHAGKVLPLDYLRRYSELCLNRGLQRHLDGARVFNAAVALDVPVSEIAQHFDTVSMCLSKGLGAPVGSVLAGDADTISRARRWRKMVGGGMRQAGVIAAAGIFALQHHVQRLGEDHARAARVAEALEGIDGFRLAWQPETNMVFLHDEMPVDELAAHLLDAGIRISGHRWVFHQDVSDEQVETVIAACRSFRETASPPAGRSAPRVYPARN
jgi:threonine aldolase